MDISALQLNTTFLDKRHVSVNSPSQVFDLPVEHMLKLICLPEIFSYNVLQVILRQ
jgi:hypothetical protein